MFVSLTSNMLEYYVDQMGLPYVAPNLEDEPIGFIFQQAGGYDVSDLVRCTSVEEMYQIAAK